MNNVQNSECIFLVISHEYQSLENESDDDDHDDYHCCPCQIRNENHLLIKVQQVLHKFSEFNKFNNADDIARMVPTTKVGT